MTAILAPAPAQTPEVSDRARLTAAVRAFERTKFTIPTEFRRTKGDAKPFIIAADAPRTPVGPEHKSFAAEREDRLTARDREVIAELQAGKVEQAKTRIVRMKAKFSALKPGSRWDAQRGKWVDDAPVVSRTNATRRAQGVVEPGWNSDGTREPPRIPEGHTNYFD